MSYQQWLAERFGAEAIPEDDLDRVRSVLGWSDVDHERLLNSYNNDTFILTNATGERAFVRVARSQHSNFERERWALERCRTAGIPAPECLAVLPGDATAGFHPVSVLEVVAGVSLESCGADLDEDARTRAVEAAGRALAGVHAVAVRPGDPVWQEEHPDVAHAARLAASHDELRVIARNVGFPQILVDAAMDTLDEFLPRLTRPVQLVHGDFGPKHVLVTPEGALTAIVDFEGCTGGDGAADIAFWDYGMGDGFPTARLLAGYTEVSGLPPADDVVLLHRLMIGCAYLLGYGRDPTTVPSDFFTELADTVAEDLRRFRP